MRSLAALALGLCLTGVAGAQEAPLSATVEVPLEAKTRPYSRMLFGGFLEHFHRQIYGGIYEPGSPLSDAAGFRRDVAEAVKSLGVPIVRWPGGCFVSDYHWRDGVGRERLPSFDKAWGVEEPNTFGTDEFVAWCRLVGCAPYICGNAGTGTPEEMSDWVEYCNQTLGRNARLRVANGHAQPFGVRYWSVGNENWGGHEIGARSREEWGPLVRETAKMMRRVDTSLVLTAAALDDGWNRALLSVAGDQLNLISIHGYWDGLWSDDRPSDYATCMMRAGGPEQSIVAVERLLASTGHAGRIGIAFDEWNLRGWHHPGLPVGFSAEQIAARDRNDRNATYTMADALFSASFLNACLRHADTVKMANIAPLVNARGPLYVHPGGLVKRTTWHVLDLYANHLAPRAASAVVTSEPFTHSGGSVPAVDAVATCDATRALWRLALTNRHATRAARCQVRFAGQAANGTCPAWVLDGDSVDAFNDPDRPDRVVPRRVELTLTDGAVLLPPHSLTILEIRRPPSDEPLLGEPGFERDSPDWRPMQWGRGEYRAIIATDVAHGGARSALLETNSGADCAWTQRVEVHPHSRYQLSGWIRCRGVQSDSGRGAFLNVQEVQGPTTPPLTGTHDWTRVEMTFDTGAQTSVQINCLLGGWGLSRGEVWFDDLALGRLGDAP